MNRLILATLAAIVSGLLLLGCEKEKTQKTPTPKGHPEEQKPRLSRQQILVQLEAIDDPKTIEGYVEEVIIKGSSGLGFASGNMQPGFASPEDARKIAAYVVTLSGQKSPHSDWVTEGNLLYNGNCAGCHGDDGKGLGGAFLDLTQKRLLGLEKRKKELQDALKKAANNHS